MKSLDFWVVGWKFTKFTYLKLQVSFSLNFASLFSVMRDNSFVLFLAETLYYFEERSSFVPNLNLDRLFLLKVYKISAIKVHRSCASWPWRLIQNLKKNWFLVSKLTRIWWILIQALKSPKTWHFDWSLPGKICNVWSKNAQRSYLSWH